MKTKEQLAKEYKAAYRIGKEYVSPGLPNIEQTFIAGFDAAQSPTPERGDEEAAEEFVCEKYPAQDYLPLARICATEGFLAGAKHGRASAKAETEKFKDRSDDYQIAWQDVSIELVQLKARCDVLENAVKAASALIDQIPPEMLISIYGSYRAAKLVREALRETEGEKK